MFDGVQRGQVGRCGDKMCSSTTVDPCGCSMETYNHTEHRAGIDRDPRNRGDVTIAEVVGVVAKLKEKVRLLREEILELKDSGSISVGCTSVFEGNTPPGLPMGSKRPARSWGHRFFRRVSSIRFFKKKLLTNACDEYRCKSRSPTPRTCTLNHVGTETKIVNEQMKDNDSISPNNNEDRESGSGRMNTSSENCSLDGFSCQVKCGKTQIRSGWDKSTHVEPEKSNKCINTNCKRYGRRVRKRISRGVQTLPNRKHGLSRVKRNIGNLWKFKWHFGRSCGKDSENCRAAIGATSHAELQSVDAINKPRKHNKRKVTIPDTAKSDNGKSAVKSDEKAREKPVQVNRSDVTKKNYKRKYDFSVNGTDIEIVHAGDGNSKVLEKSGTETAPAKAPITGRRDRSKSKEKAEIAVTGKPIIIPLAAKRNDIADVKKRLDVCIADLIDIISNLSKGLEQDPRPRGPAGEGPAPKNVNSTPRGRSRLR